MKDRIAQIHKKLWVGGDAIFSSDLEADLAILNDVDVIIDVRSLGELEPSWKEVVSDYPTYLHFGLNDDGINDNDWSDFIDLYAELNEVATKLKMRKHQLKIFVHCHMGVNRSPSVCMFLLMAMRGVHPYEAFQMIREARPQAFIAYAGEAVQAAQWMKMFDSEFPSDSEWSNFEDEYWATHQDSVNDANLWMRSKHMIDRKEAKIFRDSLGRDHATG